MHHDVDEPGARGISRSSLLAAVVAGTVLLGASVAWSASRTPVVGGDAGRYTIAMEDYAFSPSNLTWRAGETVELTIVNRSQSRPGKPHEIMFGRGPLREEGPFGVVQGDGFNDPLLAGLAVELLGGSGVTMVMTGLETTLTGVDPAALMPPMGAGGMQPMRMGAVDFMAVVDPGGSLTFRFTVPDRPGTWEFGCFQQDGQHYLNGMKGTVTVVAADAAAVGSAGGA